MDPWIHGSAAGAAARAAAGAAAGAAASAAPACIYYVTRWACGYAMTQGRTCKVRRSLRKTYEQHEATAQRKSQVGR